MLEGDAAVFKCLKNLASKADLRIHHVLFNIDGTKSLLSGNSRDNETGFLAGALHNPGAVVLRRVGIPDVDRDALSSDREDGILMQNACPHVRKLPQFLIGNGINADRIGDDAGIGNQKAGHVCPVLIDLRMHRTGNDGTGNVRAAPGKGFHASVGHGAVEAGDNGRIHLFQALRQHLIRLIIIKFPMLVKENHFCRVDERKFQIGGHDDSVQIFSSGSSVILSCLISEIFLDFLKLLFQRQLQGQALDDFFVSGTDGGKLFRKIASLLRKRIAGVQHVGHLFIVPAALARRGGNNKASLRIRLDNASHLSELLRARQRASAEFHHFFHNRIILLPLPVCGFFSYFSL